MVQPSITMMGASPAATPRPRPTPVSPLVPPLQWIVRQAVRDVRDLLRLAPRGLELRELALQRAALGLLLERHLERERLGPRQARLRVARGAAGLHLRRTRGLEIGRASGRQVSISCVNP